MRTSFRCTRAGLSTREIQQHLEEIYHVEVSPALISSVTDEVIDEVKTWQNRQLDAVYPIMYLDAIQFKVRDSGHVRNKAIYLAIGITIERAERSAGVVDRADGRGQVLAASGDGTKESRRKRHLYRLRGRAERFSRSD